jgi:hypothetical protein
VGQKRRRRRESNAPPSNACPDESDAPPSAAPVAAGSVPAAAPLVKRKKLNKNKRRLRRDKELRAEALAAGLPVSTHPTPKASSKSKAAHQPLPAKLKVSGSSNAQEAEQIRQVHLLSTPHLLLSPGASSLSTRVILKYCAYVLVSLTSTKPELTCSPPHMSASDDRNGHLAMLLLPAN